MAITGSAGKTTTKEIAAELLAASYRVFRNKGNLNNHIGLPLSLLELRARPEIAVVELGMNHPGEIRTLVGIAEPDVRVWTNVGDAHLGFFESADAIADAKAEILEGADGDDVLVANANDARVMSRAEWFLGRVVTFGIETAADVSAVDVEHRGLAGTSAELRTPAGSATLTTPLLGLGNLSNVLAATAVAIQFDVPVSHIVETAATTAAGDASRRAAAAAGRDHAHRRLVQLQPRGVAPGARHGGGGRRMRPQGRRARRDARARRPRRFAAPRIGPCRGGGLARSPDRRRRRGRARAGRCGNCGGNAGRARSPTSRPATRRRRGCRAGRPGDLVLVKGSRGIGTDLVVDAAEGGVRLMLYHLLPPLTPWFSVLNVTRYITFRTALASMTALALGLVLGPWMIRKLQQFQIGQVIRHEGPATHRTKAGTPTMGGLLILTATLVPTLLWADLAQPVHLDRRARDGRLWRDWLRRRLSQDRPAIASRPASALQAVLAIRRRPERRRRP